MEKKYIITIGRQLGSGGKQIGEILSKRLNISCYDKELLQLASKESGLCPEFFEQADEKNNFSLLRGLSSFWEGDFFTNNYLSNESLFKIQSDVMQELASRQSCIFVGRCADYVLRNHPRLLSVFITANIEDRIKQIAQSQQLTEEKARTLIEQTDKKRATYYNYYSNKTWGMATSYDFCINSSTFSIEETAVSILHFVQKKFNIHVP
ncbi:MAG: cytidylate kinase-like family protein [Bacteroidales bacterium]|jgi:cytidylate kinase|nr:cytidylate kinase-like family protein [Bacteroidales bacterium]